MGVDSNHTHIGMKIDMECFRIFFHCLSFVDASLHFNCFQFIPANLVKLEHYRHLKIHTWVTNQPEAYQQGVRTSSLSLSLVIVNFSRATGLCGFWFILKLNPHWTEYPDSTHIVHYMSLTKHNCTSVKHFNRQHCCVFNGWKKLLERNILVFTLNVCILNFMHYMNLLCIYFLLFCVGFFQHFFTEAYRCHGKTKKLTTHRSNLVKLTA